MKLFRRAKMLGAPLAIAWPFPQGGRGSVYFQDVSVLLGLALPLIFTLFTQRIVGITDAIFLGSLGSAELAAGGLATTIFFTTLTLMNGLMSSLSVLVAHAKGEQCQEDVTQAYSAAMALALGLSFLMFLLMSSLQLLLSLAGVSARLAADVGRCGDILRWGAPAALIGISVMRSLLPALGGARLLFKISLLTISLNVVLNYSLIHGPFGLPSLGLLGSPTATVCTLWVSALLLLVQVHCNPAYLGGTRLFQLRSTMANRLLALGIPVSIALGAEATVFLATGMRIGIVEPEALASHQIAFNVIDTIFCLPLALAQAANVRIAFLAGAMRWKEVIRFGKVAMVVGAACMLGTSIVLFLLPNQIVDFYLNGSETSASIAFSSAVSLLLIAALFQLGDGLQTVASSCLRGMKDVRVPMLITCVGYWGLGFLPGQLLASIGGLGARGMWWGLAFGVTCVAAALAGRFFIVSRREMLARDPQAVDIG